MTIWQPTGGNVNRLTRDNLLNQCRLYVGDARGAFTHEEQLALAQAFLDQPSLESVRSEALEEAAKFANDKWMHGRENVVAGIRALQSPARVAEGDELSRHLESEHHAIRAGTEEKANPCGRSGPVSALDTAAMVKRLRADGRTLLCESHFDGEPIARLLCEAAALIEKLGQPEYDCMICGGIVHGPFSKPDGKLHQRHSGKRPTFPAIECPKCGYEVPPPRSGASQ